MEVKGWLTNKLKEAVAKPWHRFAGASRKGTDMGLEVGITCL
jgi:hypothetical protein